jgi:hypothetical protein
MNHGMVQVHGMLEELIDIPVFHHDYEGEEVVDNGLFASDQVLVGVLWCSPRLFQTISFY